MSSVKTRFIPTAVVLAVLGLGAVAVVPQFAKTDNGNGEDRNVVLTVDFVPVKRTDAKGVVIVWTGGAAISHHESPWIETVYVPKGSMISLTVTQHVNGYLRCVITQNRNNFHERDRTTLGAVKCRLKIT